MHMLSWEPSNAPAIPVLTSFLRHIEEIGIRPTLFFQSKNEICTDFPDYPDCVITVHTL